MPPQYTTIIHITLLATSKAIGFPIARTLVNHRQNYPLLKFTTHEEVPSPADPQKVRSIKARELPMGTNASSKKV